jgi:hypothetical protein
MDIDDICPPWWPNILWWLLHHRPPAPPPPWWDDLFRSLTIYQLAASLPGAEISKETREIAVQALQTAAKEIQAGR